MRTSRFLVVFVLALAIAPIAGGRQLAMLVEVAPLGVVDDGTLTEITVRIAPEDRAALTEDVMLWVELSREETRVLRRGWAIKIDDPDQPVTVEIVIPDGPHVLRVDLEGTGERSTGVWWGDVDVSVPASASESESESDDSGQRQEAAAGSAAATATATAAATATATAAAAATAADVASVSTSASASDCDPVPDSVPVPPSEPASEPVFASPPVVAEPVRRSGAGELTIAVTRNHRPVVGLVATQFKIEIDRDVVSTTLVAGPNRGPLNLAFALDLHEESSADLAWVGEMVRRLVERAGRGPRDVFVTGNHDGFRRAGSGDAAPMIAPAGPETENHLPALVRSSLEGLRSTTGATVLLVITDGSGPRSGKAWSDVHRAASETGVPILVAGIWNEDFGSGLRRDLRKLASASGGAVFYVQGPGHADNLVERFGAILEGCTTVGVDAPPGTPGVEVSLIGVDADLHASTAVRWGAEPADPQTGETRRGRFTYMADAALFEDCGSGRRFPVAMEADYLAAERAYLETRTEPGRAVLMTIEGGLESRPPMEGDGLIEMMVIDRFIAVHAGEDCE